MQILVFGAGAMGSFLGGLLAARHDVTLVGRPEHVSVIRAKGLRIIGKTSRVAKLSAHTTVPTRARADLVIVATKAYDTPEAMRRLKPFAPTALFLSLQNGLEGGDILAKSARRVVVGTTAHGVTFVGPGRIRHAGVGETVIGPWSNAGEDDLVRLRDILEEAGIHVRIESDIRTELWGKVIVNASINPLGALAGVPNGQIVKDKHLHRAAERVCREATAIARAEGAPFDPDEIFKRTILVATRTASNRSSMLQDLDHGRRTEIDAITGAIVRAASRHSIDVPLNEALYALVRAREESVA